MYDDFGMIDYPGGELFDLDGDGSLNPCEVACYNEVVFGEEDDQAANKDDDDEWMDDLNENDCDEEEFDDDEIDFEASLRHRDPVLISYMAKTDAMRAEEERIRNAKIEEAQRRRAINTNSSTTAKQTPVIQTSSNSKQISNQARTNCVKQGTDESRSSINTVTTGTKASGNNSSVAGIIFALILFALIAMFSEYILAAFVVACALCPPIAALMILGGLKLTGK